jgi:hypothetical protein
MEEPLEAVFYLRLLPRLYGPAASKSELSSVHVHVHAYAWVCARMRMLV